MTRTLRPYGLVAVAALTGACANVLDVDGSYYVVDATGADRRVVDGSTADHNRKDGSPKDVTHPNDVESRHDTKSPHDAVADVGHITDAGLDAPLPPNPCADAAPQSWTTIAPGPLPGRDQAGIFWTGTDYLVYGGTDWGSDIRSEMSPDGGPSPVLDGGWQLGCGLAQLPTSGSWNGYTCSDGARYNPTTNTWTSISNVGAPPAYRWDPSWAYGNGQLFTFGGHGGAYGGWIYDVTTDTWKQTTKVNVPTPRAYHVSYFIPAGGGQFFIWGGENTQNVNADGSTGWPVNTGAYYNPKQDTYTSIESNVDAGAAPGGAYYATASSDTQFFVWGGTQDPTPWISLTGNVTNQGYIYSYAGNSWTKMTTLNAPEARHDAQAVWTGSKFVVWGGIGANGAFPYTDGGIYDPVTDTWVTMSNTNGPALTPHTMEWTGKRVLLWGTTLDGGAPTGAVFDPVANAWDTPITNTGAPAFAINVYTGYTNLWSGTQMLQWGGLLALDGGYAVPNGGALYTPACTP